MRLSKILLDTDLIKSLLLSILYYCYNKLIILILLYIPDYYLCHIIKPIIHKNDIYSDESSSSSEELSDDENINLSNLQYNTLDEYNKFIQLWEYDVILYLFNLEKYSYNILKKNEKLKINKIYNIKNINIIPNNFYIIDSFLFNIKISKCVLQNLKHNILFQSIYQFKHKLILFNNINNNYVNSKNLHKLFPQYKYLFILYKYKSEYKYILVDLYNNYNLIKHKKNLFNKILIN